MSNEHTSEPSRDNQAQHAPPVSEHISNLGSTADIEKRLGSLLTQVQEAVREADQRNQEVMQQVEIARVSTAELNKLKDAAAATSAQMTETNAQVLEARESLRTVLIAAAEAANKVEALKVQIEQNAQVAATRSEHIEEGRVYVDAKRTEIDKIQTQAQQAASGAERERAVASAANEGAAKLLTELQTTKVSIDALAEATRGLRDQCEQHAVITKKLADVAVATGDRIVAYEANLSDLALKCNDRLSTIDELLPGATGAGLASAFGKRREQFMLPQRIWQCVFLAAIIGLLAVAGYDFGVSKPLTSWTLDSLGLLLLHRLPFVVPLVWLAIYSARQASLAKRLEEDYAFKEATSRSFEGYRRQMGELESGALSRLCLNTLAIISQHPGRIYEKHRSDVTPISALLEQGESLRQPPSGNG